MENQVKKEEIKNLGFENGWESTPPEVVGCRLQEHIINWGKISYSITESVCPICKIKWFTDSGD